MSLIGWAGPAYVDHINAPVIPLPDAAYSVVGGSGKTGGGSPYYTSGYIGVIGGMAGVSSFTLSFTTDLVSGGFTGGSYTFASIASDGVTIRPPETSIEGYSGVIVFPPEFIPNGASVGSSPSGGANGSLTITYTAEINGAPAENSLFLTLYAADGTYPNGWAVWGAIGPGAEFWTARTACTET